MIAVGANFPLMLESGSALLATLAGTAGALRSVFGVERHRGSLRPHHPTKV
jgi:hypothetical protein